MTHTTDITHTIERFRKLLAKHGYLITLWHIDDVRELRPDLTDEQYREVLEECDHRHDADIGINWEVIRVHADSLFPERDIAGEE